MFARTGRYATASLFLISILFFFYTCMIKKTDADAYTRKYNQKKNTSQSIQSCYQLREGVCKDIWLSEENKSRLHYRIKSDFSKLTLSPREEKVDIIESLYQIKGWIQEKLYQEGPAMRQQLRYFEADHGLYSYLPQTFVTENVSISLYRLQGIELPQICYPKDAFLKGVAREAFFTISGKNPIFQAKQFQASLTRAPL